MMSPLTHDLAAFKTPVAGQPTLFLLSPVAQFLATPEQAMEQFTVLRRRCAWCRGSFALSPGNGVALGAGGNGTGLGRSTGAAAVDRDHSAGIGAHSQSGPACDSKCFRHAGLRHPGLGSAHRALLRADCHTSGSRRTAPAAYARTHPAVPGPAGGIRLLERFARGECCYRNSPDASITSKLS